MISDPENAVLVDMLLERGAKLEVWTDEEAERCRLAAFWPMLRDAASKASRSSGISYCKLNAEGDRMWRWAPQWAHPGGGTVERFPRAFDAPDFALGVAVDASLEARMSRGKRLPAKFRLRHAAYGRAKP